MKKLTLSADPDVIDEARELAEQTGTSVSSMFERFVRLLAVQRGAARPLGPITRKASGMIVLPKGRSERQIVEDALLEKHGCTDERFRRYQRVVGRACKARTVLRGLCRLWTLAEQGKICGFVSALSFSNVYYIVRRLKDRRTADRAMLLLRDTLRRWHVMSRSYLRPSMPGMKDFEDAIQYFGALRADAVCLVSRNPDHFPHSVLSVVTPPSFSSHTRSSRNRSSGVRTCT